jgi:hypothetical protein
MQGEAGDLEKWENDDKKKFIGEVRANAKRELIAQLPT